MDESTKWVGILKTNSEILRNTSFRLQLDETTTSNNNALLMAYVRYIADGNNMEAFILQVLRNGH